MDNPFENIEKQNTQKEDTKSTVIFDPPHIPDPSGLRDYQAECIKRIEECKGGSHLIVLPTGSGKTFCFSHIPRHGRVLILSHRDELVHQPEKYYDCSFGVEQANEHSNGEEVVSASVQSLIRRLQQFDPYDFDMIITDEAHHAVANSYRKVYDYFKPRLHLGFTATPDRADKSDLNQIFDDILYMKDMKWGIREGYLTDIDCYQIDVGYDLRNVPTHMGDYKVSSLSEVMNRAEVVDAVAETYEKYHKGQTLIFAVSVNHAYAIAEKIPNSVVVTAETPKDVRAQILEDFKNRKIPCLVNCMLFTEGTDLPLIETVIMARPTQNESLYCQMLGRGLRPSPGKEALTLLDCVGVSKKEPANVGHLFGLNLNMVPKKKRKKLQGVRITEMEDTIAILLDGPDSWINNAKRVKIFADENQVDLHDINFVPMGDNSLIVSIDKSRTIRIPNTDALGKTAAIMGTKNGSQTQYTAITTMQKLQSVIDDVYAYLVTNELDTRNLWDMEVVKRWGDYNASDKQIDYIKVLATEREQDLDDINLKTLTKHQASVVIDRLSAMPKKRSLASIPGRKTSTTAAKDAGFAGTTGWYK